MSMNKAMIFGAALALCAGFSLPAFAVTGDDTAAGTACTIDDATRITADASGENVLLKCTGGIWVAVGGGSGGDIQSGITTTAALGGACTTLGELRTDGSGNLLVCDDDTTSQLDGGTCASFNAGALTFHEDGRLFFCANE